MPLVYVTRRERFCAAHTLGNLQYSPEENKKIFGKCATVHGHNYELEVTIAGEVDEATGYVVDLKALKDIIRKEIIQKVDHLDLNNDVGFLKGINPTAENIVRGFWRILESRLPAGKLSVLRLRETDNNVVEYRGE